MIHTQNSQRISKAFYLAALALILGASVGCSTYLITQTMQHGREAAQAAIPLLFLPLTAAVILTMRLWYRMWSAIQDGHARTTPGRAVGLMFVPLFNVYWVFVAFWGFSKDYNRLIERRGITAPRLPEGLFLIYLILPLCAWIPVVGFIASLGTMVIGFVLVAKICDAVNALPLAFGEAALA